MCQLPDANPEQNNESLLKTTKEIIVFKMTKTKTLQATKLWLKVIGMFPGMLVFLSIKSTNVTLIWSINATFFSDSIT